MIAKVTQKPATGIFSVVKLRDLSCAGFQIVDNFLGGEMVREVIGAIETLKPDTNASRLRRGVPFARRNLLELDFVRKLIVNSQMRELLDAVAPGLIAVRAILFDKNESANWTVPWHQDRSIAVRERIDLPGFGPWSTKTGVVHVQPPLDILRQMLTVRFHLDPCGRDNGPLRVIAGTHNCILDQNEVEAAVASSDQTACTTGAGGLVMMRPLILHASSPAIHPAHRRVIHIEFGPRALPGALKWAVAYD